MKNIIAFDLGTTRLKAVYEVDGILYKETHHNEDPEGVIKAITSKYPFDCIGITGSGARSITSDKAYTYLDELRCTAHMIDYTHMKEAIVVNVGTGTSFLSFKHGDYVHLTGTGIGGGTFTGLGSRLLGVEEPEQIEALARQGQLKDVNILIKDIYPDGLGWLKSDITVSNFGKDTGTTADVALGIHSLVADTIVSILKAITTVGEIKKILLSGGVMENAVVRGLITRFATIFQLDVTFFHEPGYGTCLGALSLLKGN